MKIATTLHSVFMYCATPALGGHKRVEKSSELQTCNNLYKQRNANKYGKSDILAGITVIAFDSLGVFV